VKATPVPPGLVELQPMRELHLQFLAFLAAAVAKMALGSVWYSNALFFQPWARTSGISEPQVRQGLPKALGLDFRRHLPAALQFKWVETKMPARKTVSDTITVTADGRTVVDIPKLLAKEHIQKMIREMHSKTRIASKPANGYASSRNEE